MRGSKAVVAVFAVLFSLLTSGAFAHTPYLVAVSGDASRGGVASFDASFAEVFFVPEAAFNNSEFFVVHPNGSRAAPEQVVVLKTRTVAEVLLKQEGTYRVSTGMRYGAVFTFFKHEGKEGRVMGAKTPIPEGAEITQQFQSVTKADTYVSHKVTSDKALSAIGEGLEIVPLNNPNDLFADEPFAVKVLLNGEPIELLELSVYLADKDDKQKPLVAVTDSKGVASLSLPAGKYLMRARKRVATPDTVKVPLYSYTTTLTFHVFENI